MASCPKCTKPLPDAASFWSWYGADLRKGTQKPTLSAGSRQPAAGAGPSSSVHSRFLSGQMLGARYRIVGLLGRGGIGEVYSADDLELGQSVPLKFLVQRAWVSPRPHKRG